MNNREKFKRAVIESIHGLSYKEAIKKEQIFLKDVSAVYVNGEKRDLDNVIEEGVVDGLPITIGRVMQAFHNHWMIRQTGRFNLILSERKDGSLAMYMGGDDLEFTWKLTKENGEECTDDDQSDDIIIS